MTNELHKAKLEREYTELVSELITEFLLAEGLKANERYKQTGKLVMPELSTDDAIAWIKHRRRDDLTAWFKERYVDWPDLVAQSRLSTDAHLPQKDLGSLMCLEVLSHSQVPSYWALRKLWEQWQEEAEAVVFTMITDTYHDLAFEVVAISEERRVLEFAGKPGWLEHKQADDRERNKNCAAGVR